MKKLIILLIMFSSFMRADGQNITAAEYFIDTDPGMGSGTSISITPSANVVNATFSFNSAVLGEGFHRVYVRTRDANGKWSHTSSQLFYKSVTAAGSLPNLTAAEYFIDNDPGFGSATSIPVTPGTNIVNVQFNAIVTGVTEGFHRLFVRAKDANGRWSLAANQLIYKSATGALALQPLTEVEYFIDTDPGMGKAVPVAVNSTTNMVDSIFPINVSGLSNGLHRFYIRTKDLKGSWSLTSDTTFTVSAAAVSPSILVNKVTRHEMCAGDTFRISYDARGTYTAGNVFKAELSNAAGSFASPTIVGTFAGTVSSILYCKLPPHLPDGTGYKVRVSSTTPSIAGLTAPDVLVIHNRPVAQTITGDGNVNLNYSYPYAVPSFAGSTWQWIAPAAVITQTANSASLLWDSVGQPQVIKVVETNQYGCIGDTSIKNVNVYPLKITNVVPSSLTPCPDGSLNVTANAYGVYYAGNVFTAQLSNAVGSFATPVTIGTLTPAPQPVGNAQPITIISKLPFPLVNGTNYRIRIVSSNYAITSDTSAAIVVNKPDIGIDTTVFIICQDEKVSLTSLYITTGLTVEWNTGTPGNVGAGIYRLIVTNTQGCKDTAFATVKQDIATWTGAVNSNWHTAGNWNVGHVPTEKTHVIIPAGSPACIINSANGNAASTQTRTGATLTVGVGRMLNNTSSCNPLPN